MKLAARLLALCLAAAPGVAIAQETVRSGLRLGLAAGFSLSPPPVCQGCVRYHGMGGGIALNLGWALRTELAVDLAATGSVMHFADNTDAFVGVYDVGAVGYLGRDWLRVGAGLARWDTPVPHDSGRDWRRWGAGVSLGVGHELGTRRVKLGIGGRLLAGVVGGARLASLLILCDLSRS